MRPLPEFEQRVLFVVSLTLSPFPWDCHKYYSLRARDLSGCLCGVLLCTLVIEDGVPLIIKSCEGDSTEALPQHKVPTYHH